MPTIPVYRAEEGLDTAASSMPEIGRLDAAAVAMQNVGQEISQLGAHMIQRAKQKENTDAAFLYNEEVIKAAETSNRTIDEDATEDGSGLTDTGVTSIKTSNLEALNQIRDPKLRKEYAQKFDHLQRRHALHLSNVENTKRTNYYTSKSEGYATNRSIHLRETPDDYETLKAENDAEIDGMPITPAAKKALKESTNKILLDGKADGDYKKNPAELRRKLGATESKSTSGGYIPGGKVNNELRSKQLAYVWHELKGNDDAPNAYGKGSEGAAYNRLKAATNLTDAVRAGFTYERPAKWNLEARLRYARQVFTGQAPAAAMQARKYFESKGLSSIQASGLVGVLMGESGSQLNPGAKNPDDPGTSVGVAQWNRDRKASMYEFVKNASTEGGPGPGLEPGAGLSAPGVATTTETVSLEVDSEYSGMSYEWRKARINKIDADILQQQNDEYIAAAARTEQVTKDALASIQANGDVESIVEPTLNDFIMASKGDTDAGIDRWIAYQTAKDAAKMAYKFKGMSNAEINDALEQYRVDIPVGEGADTGEKLYSFLKTAAKEIIEPRERQEKLEASIRDSWTMLQLKWDESEVLRARQKYAAAEAAAKSEEDARQNHPWDYVMGGTPGDRNNAYASVKAAWKVVSENPPSVPGYTSMTAVAIDTTYRAQKHLDTKEHNMQLLDPRYVEAVVGQILSDTNDLSLDQKMNSLAAAFSLTSNPKYRNIIFNQFRKAGLPNEMRFALDAWERKDMAAYSMLFYPALSKDLKPVDDTKLAEYKEEANKLVNSELGQVEFGHGIMDPRSIENIASASKLITNFAIMVGGKAEDSAAMAFKMMVGPKHLVTSTLGYGTEVNVSADDGIDDNKLTDGFNNLTVDVEAAYISVLPDRKDEVARTRVRQGLSSGSFVNYEDGYAFMTLSGRHLKDPRTGEIMKWMPKDVLAAAEREGNRVPEKILKGYGLLPQDALMPEGPELDLDLLPSRDKQYTPDTADKFFQIYGGR